MPDERYQLNARVSSVSPRAILPVLEQRVGRTSLARSEDGFLVKVELSGASAQDLNRALLSALRRAEKKTTIRSHWTAADGTTYQFFDYVLKKTSRP